MKRSFFLILLLLTAVVVMAGCPVNATTDTESRLTVEQVKEWNRFSTEFKKISTCRIPGKACTCAAKIMDVVYIEQFSTYSPPTFKEYQKALKNAKSKIKTFTRQFQKASSKCGIKQLEDETWPVAPEFKEIPVSTSEAEDTIETISKYRNVEPITWSFDYKKEAQEDLGDYLIHSLKMRNQKYNSYLTAPDGPKKYLSEMTSGVEADLAYWLVNNGYSETTAKSVIATIQVGKAVPDLIKLGAKINSGGVSDLALNKLKNEVLKKSIEYLKENPPKKDDNRLAN